MKTLTFGDWKYYDYLNFVGRKDNKSIIVPGNVSGTKALSTVKNTASNLWCETSTTTKSKTTESSRKYPPPKVSLP